MRKQYSTSLQPNIIKELKLRAVEEDRPANEVVEDALQNYLGESVKMLNMLKTKGFRDGNNNYYLDINNKNTIKKYFEEDADKLEQIDSIDKMTLYINSELDGCSYSVNDNANEEEDSIQKVIEFVQTILK